MPSVAAALWVEAEQARVAKLGVSLDWLVLGSGPEPTSEQVKTAVAQARARRAQTPDSPALAATGS